MSYAFQLNIYIAKYYFNTMQFGSYNRITYPKTNIQKIALVRYWQVFFLKISILLKKESQDYLVILRLIISY